jgi:hypothetical protein
VIRTRLASLARWRRGGPKAAGPALAFAAGVAASVFTTSVAAAAAGYQANRSLQPLELTLRVGLLVAAPCMGAVLATLVLPRRGAKRPVWAIAAGAAAGPLIVLRLDRLLGYGWRPALAGVAALVVWTLVSAAVIVAAGAGRARPSRHGPPAAPPPPAPPPASGGAFTATSPRIVG